VSSGRSRSALESFWSRYVILLGMCLAGADGEEIGCEHTPLEHISQEVQVSRDAVTSPEVDGAVAETKVYG
jgi:hypothetical protein